VQPRCGWRRSHQARWSVRTKCQGGDPGARRGRRRDRAPVAPVTARRVHATPPAIALTRALA
jgi:hypothetical protein